MDKRTEPSKKVPYSNNENQAFYQVMRPIILGLRFFGRFPYTQKDEMLQYKWCCGWTIYTAVLNVGLVCVMGLVTTDAYGIIVGGGFDAILMQGMNILVNIGGSFTLILVWFEAPNIINYFASWYAYQVKLERCEVKLDIKMRRRACYVLLLMIPYLLALSLLTTSLLREAWLLPVYLILFSQQYLCMTLWTFMILFCRSTADKLLLRLGAVVQDQNSHRISECRWLWIRLADLSSRTGSVMGPFLIQLMVILGPIFLGTIYDLLFIVKEIKPGNQLRTSFIANQIALALLSAIVFILICEFGECCSNRVGEKFLNMVLNLNLCLYNVESRRELEMFIHTIKIRYPDVLVGNYFTLNRRLLVSIMGSALTYLIVLAQFKYTDEPPVGEET